MTTADSHNAAPFESTLPDSAIAPLDPKGQLTVAISDTKSEDGLGSQEMRGMEPTSLFPDERSATSQETVPDTAIIDARPEEPVQPTESPSEELEPPFRATGKTATEDHEPPVDSGPDNILPPDAPAPAIEGDIYGLLDRLDQPSRLSSFCSTIKDTACSGFSFATSHAPWALKGVAVLGLYGVSAVAHCLMIGSRVVGGAARGSEFVSELTRDVAMERAHWLLGVGTANSGAASTLGTNEGGVLPSTDAPELSVVGDEGDEVEVKTGVATGDGEADKLTTGIEADQVAAAEAALGS